MDQHERRLIEDLFGKLRQAEAQSGPRDPEAEGLIRTLVMNQPAAPYLMAQAIVVQEHALAAAQQRIQELEEQAAQGPQQASGGGLFGGLFGGGQQPARPAPRSMSPRPQAGRSNPWGGAGVGAGASGSYGHGAPMAGSAFGQGYQQRQGGGFMAGAMQTAVGVAGGVLLGNAIAGMFAGDATAAEAPAEVPPEDTAHEDPGMDAGFDGGGFEEM